MKIPLVLLSGLLSNKALWDHQISHLNDIASIQVISASQNTPEKMVHSILEEAPPQFALAGHSMGGWLCLEIMRAMPSRVMQLCLLNTTAREDSEEKRRRRRNMIRQTEEGLFQEVVDELVENLTFNAHVKQAVKTMFLSVGEKVFIHQQQAMLARKECQSILPNISCPTLVMHAAYDKVFSLEEQRELVEKIPKAQLSLVEGSGHMAPMEKPQAVTMLLRFWLNSGNK